MATSAANTTSLRRPPEPPTKPTRPIDAAIAASFTAIFEAATGFAKQAVQLSGQTSDMPGEGRNLARGGHKQFHHAARVPGIDVFRRDGFNEAAVIGEMSAGEPGVRVIERRSV